MSGVGADEFDTINAEQRAYVDWTVDWYHRDVDWEQTLAGFQRTAEVAGILVDACVDAEVFGDPEFTALKSIPQITRITTLETKREYIQETRIDDQSKQAAIDRLDEDVGIVGGTAFPPSITADETEADLIDIFGTLRDASASEASLDAAVERLLGLDIENVAIGTLSSILHLLHPTRYPVVNNRTMRTFRDMFNLEISNVSAEYLDEIAKYDQVRSSFEFKDHFRDLDFYCHWAAEESPALDWYTGHNIGSREVWQINAGRSNYDEPGALWPIWRDEGICSLAWDVGDLTDLSHSEIEARARDVEGDNVAQTLERFCEELRPGQLIVAKDEATVLGLGVVQDGGYAYRPELVTEATDGEIDHPHIQPVDWIVVPGGGGIDTQEFDMETGLTDRHSRGRTSTFEQLRRYIGRQADDQLFDSLVELEAALDDFDTGPTPRQEPATADYFILKTGSDEYEDVPDEVYHFRSGIPGSKQLRESSDARVVYLEDDRFFATARVESIRSEDRDGERHYFADIGAYEEIDTVPLDAVAPTLEVRLPAQPGIMKISQADFEQIVDHAESEPTDHFWITANPSIWEVESIKDGGEIFYTAYSEPGTKRRVFSAFEAARPGDRVVFYQSSPIKEVVAVGEITEGLHPEPSEGFDEPVEGVSIRYVRPVNPISWKTLKSIPDLENASPITNQAQGSLFELSSTEYDTILSLEEGRPPVGFLEDRLEALERRLEAPHFEIAIPDGLYFDHPEELRRQIESTLNSGKHIIFTGPPGTGKTKLAKAVSEQCVDGDVVTDHRFTTATSEWTAFDTIGGYVPARSSEGDELIFQPRLFLKCFRERTLRNDWLVIDEINRADIDKAFGQLFSVLSGDSVELPYERENAVRIESLDSDTSREKLEGIVTDPDAFPVTPSWRLMATMNTYDKASLYELSYAFMRRFNFIHVGVPDLKDDGEVRVELLDPDYDGDNYAHSWTAEDSDLAETLATHHAELAVLWRQINEYRTIGPSIVRDILGYVHAAEVADPSAALTDAIIALVFPQLEGMRPQDQQKLIQSISEQDVDTTAGSVNLEVDQARLERKAEDFFDITFEDDD